MESYKAGDSYECMKPRVLFYSNCVLLLYAIFRNTAEQVSWECSPGRRVSYSVVAMPLESRNKKYTAEKGMYAEVLCYNLETAEQFSQNSQGSAPQANCARSQ